MPPLAVAAGIAAVGTIGGALIGQHAQSQAADQAAQTQNNATAAQLQLGRESLAQNQAIYNSNYDTLSPWVSRGNVAGDSYNALLGLPAAPHMTSPLAAPTGGTGGSPLPAYAAYNGPSMSAISAMQNDGIPGNYQAAMSNLNGWRMAHPGMDPFAPPPAAAPTPAAATPAPTTTGRSGTTAANALSPQAALNNFANSAGMQFQLQQGSNALNNLYAGNGTLQSGAAMKGINNYAQQTALQNYFMPYMSMVNGVSNQGLSAGSAIAGVGQNAANTAANINSGMGNAINSGAQNIGNLQLANGQNQASMYGRIGGALGNFASSFGGGFGSSMPSPDLTTPWGVNLPSSSAAPYLPGGLY